MKVVLQKVSEASVSVADKELGEIGLGYVLLVGIQEGDTEVEADYLVKKINGLRIFEDENEKMNLSLDDVKGEVLIVSQFTLYGNCIKGRRPAFIDAARPELAENLYLKFVEEFRSFGIKTETGEFAADMKVELLNDGPVTLIIDTADANIK